MSRCLPTPREKGNQMSFNQNKFLLTALLGLVLSLTGCAQTRFVVLRDVPPSPSFVVIPANDYLSEVTFANEIERAILGAGVKVVMRPSTKEVTTEKVTEETEGNQASGMKLTERYFAFDEIDADYIVQTYATSNPVKITKRETQEVLTVLTVQTALHDPAPAEWKRKRFKQVLAKMGIPVTNY